jgi:hypothetical protein
MDRVRFSLGRSSPNATVQAVEPYAYILRTKTFQLFR